MDRLTALGTEPVHMHPDARVRLSAAAAASIADATPPRDAHLRGHTVIGAIMDEIAGLPVRLNPAVPPGLALVVVDPAESPMWRPPTEVRVSGDPRSGLDIDPA